MFRPRTGTLFVATLLLACDDQDSLQAPPPPTQTAVPPPPTSPVTPARDAFLDSAQVVLVEGRNIFRYDTFGDEAFWGGQLRLHEAIAGERLGGVGGGLSPGKALSLGLKVDVEALPEAVIAQLEAGTIDLEDPATTLALLEIDAVVGVAGFFEETPTPAATGGRRIVSLGITCAFCHSTVDDSFAPGIGRRLDGWPNRDLDVGTIVSLAPDLSPFTSILGVDEETVRAVLESWGPGKYDAHLLLDGRAFRPDGRSSAVLLPAAFGLAGVNLVTYTGWGSVTYWNAFVANTQMHGQGTFWDPRLEDPERFPIADRLDLFNLRADQDQITSKLASLHQYQLMLLPPEPPAGSYDMSAAERGRELFNGKARCAQCHVPPLFTEPGWNMHTPDEIGIDDFQASRSPDGHYRTTPLRGLFTRMKGGFYHDGRFATLDEVIDHYQRHMDIGISEEERTDLIEYLQSL